jgi:hypothetical protein
MTTQNKAVTCYLPKDIEDFITGYCNEYGITRKDKEGNIYPSLGTGIIELLKLLAYNPELVGSPILDTVPSKFSEDAIEKKIDEILEKKLNSPDTVPSQVTDLEGKVESIILDKLPSIIPEYLPSDLLARIENMERLLRLQQSASIASPIPTGEPSPLPPPARPAIETVTPEVSPSPPSPPDQPAIASIDGTVTGAIEDSEKKIMEPVGGSDSLDTLPVPPITDKTIDQNAIEDLTDQSSSPAKKKGLTDSELARHLGIDKSNITRWKQKGEPTQKYRDKWEFRGRLWYEKD